MLTMAASPSSRLQSMMQAAVQSVQWTYSLFWQLYPQQGMLRWGDGFYNGEIKTRRTGEAMEVSTEDSSLQRSQQLRELYESLSAGHGEIITDLPTRWPCVALSPEDLSELEWFYLMCVSFSFPSGVGLPGKAYARRQHVWLAGANEADSKTFARAILAKSAHVQTVVCIPLLEGVVEFGTTDKVQEDIDFIQHVKSFFIGHHHPTPNPALAEHFASNPSSTYPAIVMANISNDQDYMKHDEEAELLDPEAETVRKVFPLRELTELEMLEDSLVGSPDDGSNLLDSAGLELLPLEPAASELYPGEYDNSKAQISHLGTEQVIAPLEDFTVLEGHTQYSKTMSNILQNIPNRWPKSPSISHVTYSFQSAFTKWSTNPIGHHLHMAVTDNPQWLLKYILFTVPYLHAKQHHYNSPQTLDQGKGPPQDELITSHVEAERRRREKLNEKFITLRSLVPFVTKMDKASILGDTIEYMKQLHEKVQVLEARNNHKMEENQRWRSAKKRKERVVEVSIIEGEVLLEVECTHREGLLLDLMKMLREVEIEVIGVQSSLKGDGDDGVFVAELRAKVKENTKGNKVSVEEVKKALHSIITPHDQL